MAARLIALVLVLALSAVVAMKWGMSRSEKPAPTSEREYQLNRYDCPSTELEETWLCARLITPGEAFSLEVRVLLYRGEDKRPEPLIYLQGGPGLDADFTRAGLEKWGYWRDYAGLKRDLVVMQRRGTGPESPHQCRAYDRLARQLLGEHLRYSQETERGRRALNQCLARAPGFDPADYGTRENARDLRALVRLMGLEQWHLYGVSYGSRLALAAASSPGLQTLILDSVYPPGRGGMQQWPDLLGAALTRFADACASDRGCQTAWQHHYAGVPLTHRQFLPRLRDAMDYLRTRPIMVDITHDRLPVRVVVNDHRLLTAVYAASYRRARWADVIQAMAGVKHRSRDALRALIQSYANQALSTSVNSLTFMAVDCRDNPIGELSDYQTQLQRHPMVVPYLETGWEEQLCQQWPAAEPPRLPDYQSINATRVHLLSGEYDPITPSHWAKALKHQWPAAQLTVFPGVGHSVFSEKPCALAQLESVLSGQSEGFSVCD